MSKDGKALNNSQTLADRQPAGTLTRQAQTQANDLSLKVTGLIDRYNRMLDSAPAAELEQLVNYVNFMAAKKEPLFVLLKGNQVDVA